MHEPDASDGTRDAFPPSLRAAQDRLRRVQPEAYARTRNHLDGAVTRLSPYITHGVLSLDQVAGYLRDQHGLADGHKLVYELGWRAYFQHVWRREGQGILRSLRPGLLRDADYTNTVPDDIRQARTGLAVIDQAVRTLYATGYLHNHARMWLASYLVHMRKVHWRAGADWLYGHLLDGDLGSNHLSWQWVAATGSTKPYLFNAENVARHAPPGWHVQGSLLDTDYDALDTWARQPLAAPAPGEHRLAALPETTNEPALLHTPPFALRSASAGELTHAWLVHPWAVRNPCTEAAAPHRKRLGVFAADFHNAWPWSARRWHFVHAAMREVCDDIVWLEDPPPASCAYTDNPHLHMAGKAWPRAHCVPEPLLWPDPAKRCNSFSQYWREVSRTAVPARAHRSVPLVDA